MNETDNFFPGTCFNTHRRQDKRGPGLTLKKDLDVQKCCVRLCLWKKTYCCFDEKSKKSKFSTKGVKNDGQKTVSVEPFQGIANYEIVNVTSSSRSFRTIEQSAATCEQRKKTFFLFYPKKYVQEDAQQTKLMQQQNITLYLCACFSRISSIFKLLIIRFEYQISTKVFADPPFHQPLPFASARVILGRRHHKVSAAVLIKRSFENHSRSTNVLPTKSIEKCKKINTSQKRYESGENRHYSQSLSSNTRKHHNIY